MKKIQATMYADAFVAALNGAGSKEQVVKNFIESIRKHNDWSRRHQILAACEDGKERHCRIPGKLKKRMWIREGDLLVVRVWDFQDEKCDIRHRYTKTESTYLSRRGMLPKTVDIF